MPLEGKRYMQSPYAQRVPFILADMERQREEDDQQQPAQEDEQLELVIHRYHVEGGGVILSSVPLEEAPQTNDPPHEKKRPFL
jgi:hypothetical protein